jgi:hypothetical protein
VQTQWFCEEERCITCCGTNVCNLWAVMLVLHYLSWQLSSPNLDFFYSVYHSSETVLLKFSHCVSSLSTCSSFTWCLCSHLSKTLRIVAHGCCSLLLACLLNFLVLGINAACMYSKSLHLTHSPIVLGVPPHEAGCVDTCHVHKLLLTLVQGYLLELCGMFFS